MAFESTIGLSAVGCQHVERMRTIIFDHTHRVRSTNIVSEVLRICFGPWWQDDPMLVAGG